MILFFTLLFGLIFGSFANMLSYRLPRDKTIAFDRSRCPICNETLPAFSLIPVLSFILQRGKCHHCKAPISWRYPLIEIMMAFSWILTYFYFGFSLQSVIGFLFLFLTIVLFVSDLETYLLPLSPMISLGLLGLFRAFIDQNFKTHLYGLLVGFCVFFVLKIVARLFYKREALGSGDVLLSSALGLFLGWHSSLLFIYISFLLGGLVGIIVLVFTSKKSNDTLPFGPILIAAASIVFFFGDRLWALLHI